MLQKDQIFSWNANTFCACKVLSIVEEWQKNFDRNKFKTLLSFLTKQREITLRSGFFVSKYWISYLFDFKVTYLQIYIALLSKSKSGENFSSATCQK